MSGRCNISKDIDWKQYYAGFLKIYGVYIVNARSQAFWYDISGITLTDCTFKESTMGSLLYVLTLVLIIGWIFMDSLVSQQDD
jgi:hypothetical protein